ncbi:hypothetical protein HK101_012083, partial [Irineochytrium annulatum]
GIGLAAYLIHEQSLLRERRATVAEPLEGDKIRMLGDCGSGVPAERTSLIDLVGRKLAGMREGQKAPAIQ